MNDKQSSTPDHQAAGEAEKPISRRKVIKTLALGGGVTTGTLLFPSEWTKPLVEAVYLPAHAQTTGPTPPQPTPTAGPTPTA